MHDPHGAAKGRGGRVTVPGAGSSKIRMVAAKALRHRGHRRPAGPDAHSRSAQPPQSPLRGRARRRERRESRVCSAVRDFPFLFGLRGVCGSTLVA